MRPKFGDIIEIPTPNGLAYALYTHRMKLDGSLLRVFNHIYDERPEDIAATVSGVPSFSVFYPLGPAVARKVVEIAGHIDVPGDLKPFPLMRSGIPVPGMTDVAVWWLWNGEREWKVGRLSKQQTKLSIRGTCNHTYLVNLIMRDWTPHKDLRGRGFTKIGLSLYWLKVRWWLFRYGTPYPKS